MSFLIGPMQKHIDGNKDLTAHNEILRVAPQARVYIPLVMGNAKIDVLVKENDKVKVGTQVAARNDQFYVPIFASVSGKVIGVEKRMGQNLRPVDHLVIESDGKNTKAENLSTLSYEASAEDIIAFMKEKGLVGCGGAGFPTYVKYQTDKCETLIINAVECEPYITSDARMIKEHIEDLRHGIMAMFKASKATTCKIAIKENKEELIKELSNLFVDQKDVEVVAVKDVYPMGWERTLVYALMHKHYDKLPIEVGCIVSNATTAIMLGIAMETGMPIVEKCVTVSGDAIKEPHNVLCPVGTPVSALIEACGGYTKDSVRLIVGGPMMGTSVTKDEVAIDVAGNAITVLENKPILELSCLRCGQCVEYCPTGLQPVNINSAFKGNDIERLEKLRANDCVECGMCSYICPSKVEVTEGIRRAKRAMALRAK